MPAAVPLRRAEDALTFAHGLTPRILLSAELRGDRPQHRPRLFLRPVRGAVVLTWLYNRSGGSVLATAVWHASFNFVAASPATAGFTAAVVSMLVVVCAVVGLCSCGLRPPLV